MDNIPDSGKALRPVSLAFFIAKRPHENLDIDWFRIFLDGQEISVSRPTEIPGNQGYSIDIGIFEEGRKFKLGWAFRTGIEVPKTDDVVLGHYPNGKLIKATRFARFRVEPFRTYEGDVDVTVVSP